MAKKAKKIVNVASKPIHYTVNQDGTTKVWGTKKPTTSEQYNYARRIQ